MQPAKCSGCGAEGIERVGRLVGKTPIGPCQPAEHDMAEGLSLFQNPAGITIPETDLDPVQSSAHQLCRGILSY